MVEKDVIQWRPKESDVMHLEFLLFNKQSLVSWNLTDSFLNTKSVFQHVYYEKLDLCGSHDFHVMFNDYQWIPSVHFRKKKQVDILDMEHLNSEEAHVKGKYVPTFSL